MKGEQNRDRADRAVERLLRETRGDTVSSTPCVDAELLAAWKEGTLPATAARAVEAHASECARCQSMLAVFARAEPGPLAPAEPFWHRWRLQWLVPAAAMATALAVWVAVPRDRPTRSAFSTFDIEQTPSPRGAAPGTGVVDPAAPAEAPTVPSTARAQQGQQGQQRRQGQPQPGASGESPLQGGQPGRFAASARNREIRSGTGGTPDVDGRLDQATSSLEETNGAAEKAAARQSAQPPERVGSANAAKSAARPEKDDPSNGSPDTIRQPASALPGLAAAPPAPASAAAAVAGSSTAGAPPPLRLDRIEAAGVRAPFDVASPDAIHRWRADTLGQVQHSSSAGAMWQPVSIVASDVLTAGQSPLGSICWLIGRNGAVWLTTDGVRFDRRPVAAPVDLISIRATDANHAAVGTSDGRTFVTTDGGVTWALAAP